MNPMQRRQLKSLSYIVPEVLEASVKPAVIAILQNAEHAKHLSGTQKREIIEKYHAAHLALLFKHGAILTSDVTVCVQENEDYDCVLKLIDGAQDEVYKIVQLKQLPNVSHAPNIQTEIDKLKLKYPTSSDLMVSIWINRNAKIDLRDLDFRGLKIEQLWLVGTTPNGDVTLHGGIISDLISGVCQARIVSDGIPKNERIWFKANASNRGGNEICRQKEN